MQIGGEIIGESHPSPRPFTVVSHRSGQLARTLLSVKERERRRLETQELPKRVGSPMSQRRFEKKMGFFDRNTDFLAHRRAVLTTYISRIGIRVETTGPNRSTSGRFEYATGIDMESSLAAWTHGSPAVPHPSIGSVGGERCRGPYQVCAPWRQPRRLGSHFVLSAPSDQLHARSTSPATTSSRSSNSSSRCELHSSRWGWRARGRPTCKR